MKAALAKVNGGEVWKNVHSKLYHAVYKVHKEVDMGEAKLRASWAAACGKAVYIAKQDSVFKIDSATLVVDFKIDSATYSQS